MEEQVPRIVLQLLEDERGGAEKAEEPAEEDPRQDGQFKAGRVFRALELLRGLCEEAGVPGKEGSYAPHKHQGVVCLLQVGAVRSKAEGTRGEGEKQLHVGTNY